ncbi:MAG: peptidoglycan bridge formation glycyltransferase FemA/FemB family protein [Candidatus Nealsonbacteria bacterium]
MKIIFKDNKTDESWDKFLLDNRGNFLQSFGWGEFQQKLLKKVWRVDVESKGKVLLQAQIIKEKIPFNNYFYIPYGPVFNLENSQKDNLESLEFLLKEVGYMAKKEKAVFLRIEPVSPLPEVSRLEHPAKRVQPKKTLILNIGKSEEEIMADFKKRARYNIRLAEKKGVKINILEGYSGIFYELLKKTKERQEFQSYSDDYFRKLFEVKGNNLKVSLFLAEYEKKVIVASCILFFGKRVISLHTGFDYRYRALKAPYLLRWRTIQEAKNRGCMEFDMWGVDELKWPGVTYLKKSFGGEEVEYGDGKEIVFNDKWYKTYRILRKILR